jgi:hypothetical protein
MTITAVLFTLVAGFFVFRLPRRWAPLPLLIGASYMTLGQQIEFGPFHFTVIRMLVAAGVFRVILRKERMAGGWCSLDRVIVLFGFCAICSSFFHKDLAATLVGRLGLAYDTLGLYFLFRIFVRDTDSILNLSKIVVIALIPIAAEMISETVTGENAFSFLGGVPLASEIRAGKVRAQGPFAHSILAGTVGAVCLPMALLFWKENRKLALIGLMSTCSIIITSKSSGPILTACFAFFGLALWRIRGHMRLVRWTALLAIVALNITMNAPVYYLIARVDLTGSSTSWYRAALMESAFNHLDEWWLGGTDYTRHWMLTGSAWSEDQADMTNYYLKMGVLGGLPLMLVFICILIIGFVSISKALRLNKNAPVKEQFLIWTLGSILFGHAATMISTSYFDQSIVFLYLVLAAIGSLIACVPPLAENGRPISGALRKRQVSATFSPQARIPGIMAEWPAFGC